MRIAFYAPLKAPTSPVPSGDRLIGRLLMTALQEGGDTVDLASRFRSYDGNGDEDRQARLQRAGEKLARRVARRYERYPPEDRPDLWFTYHLYHKAPDWIGPPVARSLGIPYVVAEASLAPKMKDGPWRIGHDSVERTLANADLAIGLNRDDEPCLRPALASNDRYARLEPFLDRRPYAEAAEDRTAIRARLAGRFGLDAGDPWLLAVAMMRPGDKVESYAILARSLSRLTDRPWRLLIAGDGDAAAEVKDAFAGLAGRTVWLGRQGAAELAAVYAASDVFVWPAVKESPGMCFLEAQAAGVPVVGCDAGGVPDVVGDGETGFLPPHRDAQAFAEAVARLLDDGELRRRMGQAAFDRVAERHDVAAAGRRLRHLLKGLVA